MASGSRLVLAFSTCAIFYRAVNIARQSIEVSDIVGNVQSSSAASNCVVWTRRSHIKSATGIDFSSKSIQFIASARNNIGNASLCHGNIIAPCQHSLGHCLRNKGLSS